MKNRFFVGLALFSLMSVSGVVMASEQPEITDLVVVIKSRVDIPKGNALEGYIPRNKDTFEALGFKVGDNESSLVLLQSATCKHDGHTIDLIEQELTYSIADDQSRILSNDPMKLVRTVTVPLIWPARHLLKKDGVALTINGVQYPVTIVLPAPDKSQDLSGVLPAPDKSQDFSGGIFTSNEQPKAVDAKSGFSIIKPFAAGVSFVAILSFICWACKNNVSFQDMQEAFTAFFSKLYNVAK